MEQVFIDELMAQLRGSGPSQFLPHRHVGSGASWFERDRVLQKGLLSTTPNHATAAPRVKRASKETLARDPFGCCRAKTLWIVLSICIT